MYTYKLEQAIVVHCITASSFPDGVLAAHQNLHKLCEYNTDRKYFGISRPEKGSIIYKAAAEELNNDEFSKHQLEQFTIAKGDYLTIDVKDFMKDVTLIGSAFQKLIHDPQIDSNGYCIEWYQGQENCRCMVKLK